MPSSQTSAHAASLASSAGDGSGLTACEDGGVRAFCRERFGEKLGAGRLAALARGVEDEVGFVVDQLSQLAETRLRRQHIVVLGTANTGGIEAASHQDIVELASGIAKANALCDRRSPSGCAGCRQDAGAPSTGIEGGVAGDAWGPASGGPSRPSEGPDNLGSVPELIADAGRGAGQLFALLSGQDAG